MGDYFSKTLEKIKEIPLFPCLMENFSEKCKSKKDLIKDLKKYNDSTLLDKIGLIGLFFSKDGGERNYKNLNIGDVASQACNGEFEDSISQNFVEDINEISKYFKEIINQNSKEELESFWIRVNSCKGK